jgi:hypothetical protein
MLRLSLFLACFVLVLSLLSSVPLFRLVTSNKLETLLFKIFPSKWGGKESFSVDELLTLSLRTFLVGDPELAEAVIPPESKGLHK